MQHRNVTALRAPSSNNPDFDAEATLPTAALTPTGEIELSTTLDGYPEIATRLRAPDGRVYVQRQRIRRADIAGVLAVANRGDGADAIVVSLRQLENETAATERVRAVAARHAVRHRVHAEQERRPGMPAWLLLALLGVAAFAGHALTG